jgi:RecA-family ATPase
MKGISVSANAAITPVRPFNVLTAEKIRQMPPDTTRWLVHNLLPAIGTSIVGAPPKAGKSVFTRQLCAFVSMGLPFLDRDVQRGKTLYFSTQERAWPIYEHFVSLGCTADTMPFVVAGERFNPIEALKKLVATLKDYPGIKLIVLDMIADFLPVKDTNDYGEMGKAFSPLHMLAEEHSLHICATHHTKKAQTENPVHAFIGSSAITGAVDQLICLNTDSRQQRSIVTAQRQGESMPLTLLNWDATKRAMYLGQSAEEVRASEVKETRDRISIDMMTWISTYPGHKRDVILDAVRGDTSTKRAIFNELEREGHLLKYGTGQKGDPYTYRDSDFSDAAAAIAA